jgi:hypothetical protein
MRCLPLALVSLLAVTPPFAEAAAPTTEERLYAVRFTTGPSWDASKPPHEQAHFADHSANLARLRRAGMLLLGARYGDTGLVVLRAVDEAAVRTELASDPTIAAGVFAIQVDRFQPFFHGSTQVLSSPEAVVLRAYLDAVNRHDTDAVVALCVEEFKFYSIAGDSVSPDATNRAALATWLQSYFRSYPDMRSEFLAIEQTGPLLAVRERVTWTNAAGARVAQQAIGVYEIRDERIARTWYFPSVDEPVR